MKTSPFSLTTPKDSNRRTSCSGLIFYTVKCYGSLVSGFQGKSCRLYKDNSSVQFILHRMIFFELKYMSTGKDRHPYLEGIWWLKLNASWITYSIQLQVLEVSHPYSCLATNLTINSFYRHRKHVLNFPQTHKLYALCTDLIFYISVKLCSLLQQSDIQFYSTAFSGALLPVQFIKGTQERSEIITLKEAIMTFSNNLNILRF